MADHAIQTTRALRPIEVAEQRTALRFDTFASPSTLGYQMVQDSIDREDAQLLARRRSKVAQQSTSDFVPRCDTCGQWPIRDELDMCRGDGGFGHPYVAQRPVGLPIVR